MRPVPIFWTLAAALIVGFAARDAAAQGYWSSSDDYGWFAYDAPYYYYEPRRYGHDHRGYRDDRPFFYGIGGWYADYPHYRHHDRRGAFRGHPHHRHFRSKGYFRDERSARRHGYDRHHRGDSHRRGHDRRGHGRRGR
jgi:hypothetical protein